MGREAHTAHPAAASVPGGPRRAEPSQRWPWRRRRVALVAALAPTLGLIVVLYLGGLGLALLQSFGYFPAAGLTQFSLDAYVAVFRRPRFLRSLLLTFWVAGASTVLSAALGLGTALLLRSLLRRFGRGRRARVARWATYLYQLNLPIPHAVGAVAVLLLLSQSGLVSRLAYAAGVISGPAAFPALVYDRFGLGIIIEYLWKTTVFTGVTLLGSLGPELDRLEETARTLGAGRWQRFRRVTLPMLRPSLLAASVLVFAFTFGGYEVPYMLGERGTSMLPVVAYREYGRVDLATRPQAMAISIVIAVVTSLMALVYMRWMER